MRHMLPSRRTAVRALAAAILLPALLTACTPSDRFAAGRPITPEELDSIGESILAADNYWDPTRDYPADTVYWRDRSAGYHQSPRCRHLSDASAIRCGSPADAAAAGKTKACSSCDQVSRPATTE